MVISNDVFALLHETNQSYTRNHHYPLDLHLDDLYQVMSIQNSPIELNEIQVLN
ncbi:unnamed protein product [Schistosoma mattheei]|uniref:Uncharacterized protein n=1 Tax=Schistosoma mattheei TaxID=31246 RepID=A0A3P8H010_9TREM|nr:unnamed protein product [Schistosoma mattheei]